MVYLLMKCFFSVTNSTTAKTLGVTRSSSTHNSSKEEEETIAKSPMLTKEHTKS